MPRAILAGLLFPALALGASCSSAQTGDSSAAGPATVTGGAIAGEPLALTGDPPFSATSHGAFDEPWALKFEPGTGRIFITEKQGTLKVYDPATGRTALVDGTPGDVSYAVRAALPMSPFRQNMRAITASI